MNPPGNFEQCKFKNKCAHEPECAQMTMHTPMRSLTRMVK